MFHTAENIELVLIIGGLSSHFKAAKGTTNHGRYKKTELNWAGAYHRPANIWVPVSAKFGN